MQEEIQTEELGPPQNNSDIETEEIQQQLQQQQQQEKPEQTEKTKTLTNQNKYTNVITRVNKHMQEKNSNTN